MATTQSARDQRDSETMLFDVISLLFHTGIVNFRMANEKVISHPFDHMS